METTIYFLPIKTNCTKMEQSCYAHTLLKRIASKKLGLSFEQIQIEYQEKGKPFLKNQKDFYFSISHTDGAVTVAVSGTEVGVDTEKIKPVNLNIAKKFTPFEQKAVGSDPEVFFEVWTKKEAYLKYLGTGLSGGLGTFNVYSDELKDKFFTQKIGEYVISLFGKHSNDIKIIEVSEDEIIG